MMLRQLRQHVNFETALLVLVLLGFALVAYMYMQIMETRSDFEKERQDYGKDVRGLRNQQEETLLRAQDVESWLKELELRKKEATEYQAAASVSRLTSVTEAEGLATKIAEFAGANALELDDFETTKGPRVVRGVEFLSIEYRFRAKGQPVSLIGLLGTVNDTLTARIESLDLNRDSDDTSVWSMNVALLVPYGDEGG
tara:strand:- start:221 stop:814 length:594 start_codon:yes stop_codon:yes gene_type:complete